MAKIKCTWFLVLCIAKLAISIEHDFKGFDDSILFSLNWPGPLENVENLVEGEDSSKPQQSTLTKEILHVVSEDQEKYECHLPEVKDTQSTNIQDYEGPSPVELLKPLFSQKICSFRLESYWNYEVCHGRYVRQYHEERDGKDVRTQEYYLGTWTTDQQLKMEAATASAAEAKKPMKTTKVEGMTLPYVDMLFNDGTICDLSGKPRVTRVMYVCYMHGKHEVYSFKEVSTCEYEIIILSPLLCQHPQFKPKEVSENLIKCHAVVDAPKKPRGALQMDIESLVFHHQSTKLQTEKLQTENVGVEGVEDNPQQEQEMAILKVEKILGEDGKYHTTWEMRPLDEQKPVFTGTGDPPTSYASLLHGHGHKVVLDDSPVRAFLRGDKCLDGGTGWWKYEFCYGKHVTQYHIDRNGEKSTLLLGTFDEAAHRQWTLITKGKQPKPGERTAISHYYTNGDICDKTGKPRETEVKLKCLENSSDPDQVSLYLLEPRTCHYILGVESPLICEILPLVDVYGQITELHALRKLDENTLKKRKEQEDSSQTIEPSHGNY